MAKVINVEVLLENIMGVITICSLPIRLFILILPEETSEERFENMKLSVLFTAASAKLVQPDEDGTYRIKYNHSSNQFRF